jgi:hypothetical protein
VVGAKYRKFNLQEWLKRGKLFPSPPGVIPSHRSGVRRFMRQEVKRVIAIR